MANDTSARPHELLNLKIKDVKFKITPNGIQYAEILVLVRQSLEHCRFFHLFHMLNNGY